MLSDKKNRGIMLFLAVLNVGFALTGLVFMGYLLYIIVTNVILKRESFKPAVDSYREDEDTKNYYINEEVHVGQKELLEKFNSMLC